VTTEDRPADGFAARMAFARQKDPTESARRTHLHLKLTAVTLAWLVAVPLLLLYGLTAPHRPENVFDVTASVTLLGPFIAAVIATKNHRFGLGGAYVVLTLLMLLPAAAMTRL
jgi:ABC-type proline/glycine betaine transport system permease subunit